MEPKSSFPACMDVQRTFDFIWFLTSRSSNSFKFDKAHIERSDSPLSTGIVRCSLMFLLTVLLQGSILQETYLNHFNPFHLFSAEPIKPPGLWILQRCQGYELAESSDKTETKMLEHFEVVCCFVFRHFSTLIPTEPCGDMSKYIVLLCLRHNCIMIRIAPISSPWTTRSALNQAAWTSVKQSNHVKPCQTLWTAWNSRRLVTKVRAIQKNPIQSRWNCCWLPCGSGTLSMIQRYNSCALWIRRCTCERALLWDVVCTPDYKIMQSSLLAIATSSSAVQILQGEESSGWRNQTLAIPGPAHPTDRQN